MKMRKIDIRARAHGRVSQAIKNAELAYLGNGNIKCTDCDKQAIYYDHRDYLKPLEVEPVCRSCNSKRGKAINWFPKSMNHSTQMQISALTYRIVCKHAKLNKRTFKAQLEYIVCEWEEKINDV